MLFSPFKIRSIEFRNRIVVSPMCTYSAHDGCATDWHVVHLGSRALGGAGAVMVEATAVLPEGRISGDDVGLWKDQQAEALRPVTKIISQFGAVPAIQLAHAGRKASHSAPWKGERCLGTSEGGWVTVAPSALPFSETTGTPKALDGEGIRNVVTSFAKAAERALSAEFRIVEIDSSVRTCFIFFRIVF